jgi:hypothetical protein
LLFRAEKRLNGLLSQFPKNNTLWMSWVCLIRLDSSPPDHLYFSFHSTHKSSFFLFWFPHNFFYISINELKKILKYFFQEFKYLENFFLFYSGSRCFNWLNSDSYIRHSHTENNGCLVCYIISVANLSIPKCRVKSIWNPLKCSLKSIWNPH